MAAATSEQDSSSGVDSDATGEETPLLPDSADGSMQVNSEVRIIETYKTKELTIEEGTFAKVIEIDIAIDGDITIKMYNEKSKVGTGKATQAEVPSKILTEVFWKDPRKQCEAKRIQDLIGDYWEDYHFRLDRKTKDRLYEKLSKDVGTQRCPGCRTEIGLVALGDHIKDCSSEWKRFYVGEIMHEIGPDSDEADVLKQIDPWDPSNAEHLERERVRRRRSSRPQKQVRWAGQVKEVSIPKIIGTVPWGPREQEPKASHAVVTEIASPSSGDVDAQSAHAFP